jgi:hypothetical protein
MQIPDYECRDIASSARFHHRPVAYEAATAAVTTASSGKTGMRSGPESGTR